MQCSIFRSVGSKCKQNGKRANQASMNLRTKGKAVLSFGVAANVHALMMSWRFLRVSRGYSHGPKGTRLDPLDHRKLVHKPCLACPRREMFEAGFVQAR